ncbi:MAG: hypothetical protein K0U68_09570 [Gammaproteobacteria bacterium]|nr:hypothetical protein [Gammaproteobacteria bacterium]
MFELLTIYQRGGFEQRTHPIIVDDCDLQSQSYRLQLVEFWEEQYQTAKSALKNKDPAVVIEEQKRVNIYRDIYQNINEIVNFAADRVTTPLAELKQQNYAPLLDRIKKVAPENISSEMTDEEYLQLIRQSLATDLKKSDVFCEQLRKSCEIEIGATQQLHDYLIDQCLSGEFVAVIQNLQSAFVDCFDSLGRHAVVELKNLYQAAQGSVSKLVLYNIKNDWMSEYRASCDNTNQNEYVLPAMSLCSVEIVSSRQGMTIPDFRIDKVNRDLQPGKGLSIESGIHSQDVTRDVITRLYASVMGRELTTNLNEDELISKLKKTIKQRKQHKNIKLRKKYFLLFPAKDSNSGLSDPAVQSRLKQLLPELSFIRLSSASHDDVFILEDEELAVAINEFFTTLEDYKLT